MSAPIDARQAANQHESVNNWLRDNAAKIPAFTMFNVMARGAGTIVSIHTDDASALEQMRESFGAPASSAPVSKFRTASTWQLPIGEVALYHPVTRYHGDPCNCANCDEQRRGYVGVEVSG